MQETIGEKYMGNGAANAVTKTGRKSGQFILPSGWFHIPMEKKISTHGKNQRNNNTNKKSPRLHSCFVNCKVCTSTTGWKFLMHSRHCVK